jgi:hypothetical protein
MSFALGRLTNVTIRDIWDHEARAFTPWLARPENIALLGHALRLDDIEVVGTEQSIGRFSTDIIGRANGGVAVLIENQLEATDHRHLGQLLTYLAGQPDEEVVVVWIATQFLEEHRAAIDWLNANTSENFEFFGVEIEVLKIGDGLAAPRFNVVAKPNDWSRDVRSTTKQAVNGSLNEMRPSFQFRTAYWQSFGDYLKSMNTTFKIKRQSRDSWFEFRIGRAGFGISATIAPEKKRIGVELYIHRDSDKVAIRALCSEKEQIEQEFGEVLRWQELPGKKASRVALYLTGIDPADEGKRQEYHAWMLDKMERFKRVFGDRIRRLDMTPTVLTEQIALSR